MAYFDSVKELNFYFKSKYLKFYISVLYNIHLELKYIIIKYVKSRKTDFL